MLWIFQFSNPKDSSSITRPLAEVPNTPIRLALWKIVGWVALCLTQQSLENVGLPCGILLRSSNATCYPTGTLRANKSGNHKGAGLPQPTQFKVFGANPSVLSNTPLSTPPLSTTVYTQVEKSLISHFSRSHLHGNG